MEATSEWNRVESLILGLSREVSKVDAKARVKALSEAVNALVLDFNEQKGASSDSELPRLLRLARGLWDEIEQATGTASPRSWRERLTDQITAGGIFGIIILLVAFAGVAALFVYYVYKAPFESLQTVEGTRPLLTIAAVVATLAFGGGLVFAALFSSEGAFENRFRMAREIFLVFSGVFATVVGFHFGKPDQGPLRAESGTPIAKPQTYGLSIRERDGKLDLALNGGTPPYKAEARIDADKFLGDGASPISIDLKGLDLGKLVSKLTIRVVDAAGVPVEVLADNVRLKDWVWTNNGAAPTPAAPK